MSLPDFLQTVASNVWALFLVVLLFGGSIFVHELGHFLAARRRGVHVERFSIGFGPAIWSHRGRDGVEYRISWIPLGGYVLLPQLADLGPLEGDSQVQKIETASSERFVYRRRNPDGSENTEVLPPVSYVTKMIVFVAGAFFNILFAFALACIVWKIGEPVANMLSSTTVAEISPTIKNADDANREVVSPAAKAGLKPGDVIVAVDHRPVATFNDIVEQLALSSGWTRNGERETIFTLRRGNETMDVAIRPVLSGPEKIRMVGFSTVAKLVLGRVAPDSIAAKAGLQDGDQITGIEGKPVLTVGQLRDGLKALTSKPLTVSVQRGDVSRVVTLPQVPEAKDGVDIGIALKTGIIYAHPSPFAQVRNCIAKTFSNLIAAINPRSDIHASHFSGPIGIISNFVDVSRAGLPFALWFTILVNVNLAIFNLLPIPVLDGGQMLFATIARLRGRPLPVNFIMTAQSVFLVLLFSMVLYVSVFDFRRIVRDVKDSRPEPAAAPAQPTPAAPGTPQLQPAK